MCYGKNCVEEFSGEYQEFSGVFCECDHDGECVVLVYVCAAVGGGHTGHGQLEAFVFDWGRLATVILVLDTGDFDCVNRGDCVFGKVLHTVEDEGLWDIDRFGHP